MAGACPVALSVAVANAGAMGAMGALLTPPDGIAAWSDSFRRVSNGSFQLNLWIPDPPPARDAEAEQKVGRFLAQWGPEVAPAAGDARPPDFLAQCAALLTARPRAVSSIMELFSPEFVTALKVRGIAWFAMRQPSPRRSALRKRGRMRSSRKGSRLAAIAALSIRPRLNGRA